MTAMTKGLILAAVHVAIVASLGGKLLVDRATRPRVWARTAPVDPDLPIRGRYVRLRLEAASSEGVGADAESVRVSLEARDGRLVAVATSLPDAPMARVVERDSSRVVVLDQPLAYFIPDTVPDPSRREAGEELWVEVTLPRRGLPRPIQLGVKRNGVLTPLQER